MGEPPQMAMSMSDVTSEADANGAYNEKMGDAACDIMVSPFIAGFFQGFIEVAKSYYREKKVAKKLAEEAEKAECEQREKAWESSEGAVWIGIPGETEPLE